MVKYALKFVTVCSPERLLLSSKLGVITFRTRAMMTHTAYRVPNHTKYEGHLESKERFAIQRYLLIIGKKQNIQVLSHTFTYFST